jgi:CheY-like chemotaxis protein
MTDDNVVAMNSCDDGRASLRVLIVDDHSDTRDVFMELLSLEGHQVMTADSGESALARLLSERFDVAVIDIGLPRMDGLEVARRAREHLRDSTPFLVAMTGVAPALAGVAPTMFDEYCVKPFDSERFLAIVASATHRRASREQ